MTTATSSITPKVTMWLKSVTAKLKYGGMKKKSKARTLKIAASIEGPYPKRIDTSTTPSKKIMTMSASCARPKSHQATTAEVTTTARLAAYPQGSP